jgi:cytochrome c oxidase subunit III
MLRHRQTHDLSGLPDTAFGVRDIMWWGTLGFALIEGFSLALSAMVYFYLRQNFSEWPPAGTALPDRLVPTVAVAIMLSTLLYMRRVERWAHAFDLERVRRAMTIGSGFCTVFVAVRGWELLQSLNVRWDANAYGSAQWLMVGLHGMLLLMQFVETVGMAAIFWLGPVEKKHFSDAADVAFYWVFIVLSWAPLYVICFLLPHWV